MIGAGYFATLHIEAWHRDDNVQLVAICDRDRDRAELAASQYPGTRWYDDAKTMLEREDLDCVDIATPPESHLALLRLALVTTKFIICQKPLAPNLTAARAMTGAAAAADATLVVHENVRFMPWHREIHRLIGAGRIGKLLGVSMRLRPGDGQGSQAYLERQPYFQSMPRFLVHETAIHWIDTFRYLGGELAGVFARLKRLNPVIVGEDAGVIVFDYATGATALFDGNRHIDHDSDNTRRTLGELYVEGDTGVIRLDGRGRLYHREHGEAEQPWPYAWRDHAFGGDCVYAFQRHVSEHLIRGTALENQAASYLRNIEIEEAIYRSAAQGRWLAL